MVRVIHIAAVYGTNGEEADKLALNLAKQLEYRSTVLLCPNGHDAKNHPSATITVQTWDTQEGRVSHSDMCCEAYYKLLTDLSVHVPPPSEIEGGEQP